MGKGLSSSLLFCVFPITPLQLSLFLLFSSRFFFLVDYLKLFIELVLPRVMKKGDSIATRELRNRTVFLTLQTPHATVHSSEVADAWFAWHSMPVKTKIKHIYAEVEDVHATPTARFLHNSKGGGEKSSLFCCIHYIRSVESCWFNVYCFPKSIRSKYTSSCFPPSSTFLVFQISRGQEHIAHLPVTCLCFPNFKDIFNLFSCVLIDVCWWSVAVAEPWKKAYLNFLPRFL